MNDDWRTPVSDEVLDEMEQASQREAETRMRGAAVGLVIALVMLALVAVGLVILL